jgi:hypothetical protein
MKSSGCESRGNPDDVLDLVLRDVEILSDPSDAVSGAEPVDKILNARAAVDDERLPEVALGVDDHVGCGASRQLELCGPTVAAVADAIEVAADDLGEMFLTGSNDGQQSLVVAVFGLVEDQLRTVGVDTLRGESVIEPKFVAETSDRGPDALHRLPAQLAAGRYRIRKQLAPDRRPGIDWVELQAVAPAEASAEFYVVR